MVIEILAGIGTLVVGFTIPLIIMSIVISNENKKDFLKKLREDIDDLQLEVKAMNYAQDKLHEDERFKRHCAMDSYKFNELSKELKVMWRD